MGRHTGGHGKGYPAREFEYGFQARRHLFVAYERADVMMARRLIEGLPKSTLREFNCKLSLVPAGHRFYGWQKPRVLTRVTYFYIDLQDPLFDLESRVPCPAISPRLFFSTKPSGTRRSKLKSEVGNSDPGSRQYAEALSLVLIHELIDWSKRHPPWRGRFVAVYQRGSRSAWWSSARSISRRKYR